MNKKLDKCENLLNKYYSEEDIRESLRLIKDGSKLYNTLGLDECISCSSCKQESECNNKSLLKYNNTIISQCISTKIIQENVIKDILNKINYTEISIPC